MVKIRLTRGGARKHAYYRVIAIDERTRRDGRALEVLGAYDPMVKPAAITLNTERIEHWVARGAQLSKAVQALFKRARKQAQAPDQAAQKRRAKTTKAKRKKEEAVLARAQEAAPAAEADADAEAAKAKAEAAPAAEAKAETEAKAESKAKAETDAEAAKAASGSDADAASGEAAEKESSG